MLPTHLLLICAKLRYFQLPQLKCVNLSFLSYLSRISHTSPTLICLGFFKFNVIVQVRKILISQFSSHSHYFLSPSPVPLPPLLFPNIHLNPLTIVSNTLKLLLPECDRPTFLLKQEE